MTSTAPGPSRSEYIARVNRVIDTIDREIDETLKLDYLAHVAAFSPFHFHRVFRSLVGETLQRYVNRLRLEKAAGLLVYHPRESITSIALDCGFGSSAHFARAFKAHFGVSATEFRRVGESKIEQAKGKIRKATAPSTDHDGIRMTTDGTETMERPQPDIRTLPAYTVAYIRHLGDYASPDLWAVWERLMRWASAHDLVGPGTEFVGIPHDDPEVTPRDRCRYDACVVADSTVRPAGEVGITETHGGRYAVWTTEVAPDGVAQAWDALFGRWLLDSGYQPASHPCIELWGDGSSNVTDGRYVVRLCLPVEPL